MTSEEIFSLKKPVFKRILPALIFFGFLEPVSAQKSLFHLFSDGSQNRYEMAFEEDFSSEPDLAKWLTSYPWGRHLIGKSEADESQEYYTETGNLEIKNGKASLVTKKQQQCGICIPWEDSSKVLSNGLRNYRCFDYTSAMLFSKKDFSYGWYEIRFRLAENSKGIWPAFWLYGGDEIDIFENKGERRNETHWDVHCKNGCKGKKGGWVKVDADFTKNFNVISLQWHNKGMRWFVNGNNYKATAQPLNSRMNIIVNQAVSRSRETEGFWVGPDQSTVFPSVLEIDYIYHYKSVYAGRKLKSKTVASLVEQQLSNLIIFSTVRKRTNALQKMETSIVFRETSGKITVKSYSGKSGTLYIYDSNGKLVVSENVRPLSTIETPKLPDGSLVFVFQLGELLFSDKVNVQ